MEPQNVYLTWELPDNNSRIIKASVYNYFMEPIYLTQVNKRLAEGLHSSEQNKANNDHDNKKDPNLL